MTTPRLPWSNAERNQSYLELCTGVDASLPPGSSRAVRRRARRNALKAAVAARIASDRAIDNLLRGDP